MTQRDCAALRPLKCAYGRVLSWTARSHTPRFIYHSLYRTLGQFWASMTMAGLLNVFGWQTWVPGIPFATPLKGDSPSLQTGSVPVQLVPSQRTTFASAPGASDMTKKHSSAAAADADGPRSILYKGAGGFVLRGSYIKLHTSIYTPTCMMSF